MLHIIVSRGHIWNDYTEIILFMGRIVPFTVEPFQESFYLWAGSIYYGLDHSIYRYKRILFMGGRNIPLIGILFRDLDDFHVYFSLLS